MSDDVPELAVETVPEPEATAPPEAVVETPEAPDEPRVFSQEELDRIVGERLARAQRKWEREQRQQAPAAPTQEPERADFDDEESFIDAKSDFLAEQKLRQREFARETSTRLEAYEALEETAKAKYDDFESVAYNPSLPVTDHMAATIQSSDIGPDIIYHLGQNPKEAARISRLSPLLQAREIGKLEASLAATPPVKRTSTAPAPINPVQRPSQGATTYDTTDPRSLKQLGTSGWIAAENARERKKAEARH